jgi:hypothetical protein
MIARFFFNRAFNQSWQSIEHAEWEDTAMTLWLLVMSCVSACLVTRLMNQDYFDPTYFLASLAGALLFPWAVAFLSWDLFGRPLDPTAFQAFYHARPRLAGAFIGWIAFNAVKALRA